MPASVLVVFVWWFAQGRFMITTCSRIGHFKIPFIGNVTHWLVVHFDEGGIFPKNPWVRLRSTGTQPTYNRRVERHMLPTLLTWIQGIQRGHKLIKWSEPQSPIFGPIVNPFQSRFIYRMPPLWDSARPLLWKPIKRELSQFQGKYNTFFG